MHVSLHVAAVGSGSKVCLITAYIYRYVPKRTWPLYSIAVMLCSVFWHRAGLLTAIWQALVNITRDAVRTRNTHIYNQIRWSSGCRVCSMSETELVWWLPSGMKLRVTTSYLNVLRWVCYVHVQSCTAQTGTVMLNEIQSVTHVCALQPFPARCLLFIYLFIYSTSPGPSEDCQ